MSHHSVPGRAAATATLATPLRTAGATTRVASVEYIPDADIAGAATNSLTVQLVNGGPDGSLSLIVAALAMVAGVNATRRQPSRSRSPRPTARPPCSKAISSAGSR